MPAEVLFVGEAPGGSEDFLAYPFAGPAGKAFDALVIDSVIRDPLGLPWWVDNTVACRPTNRAGGNRQPEFGEQEKCRPRFASAAEFVQPSSVVLMGRTASDWAYYMLPPTLKGLPQIEVAHPSHIRRTCGRNWRTSSTYAAWVAKLDGFLLGQYGRNRKGES